MTDDPTTLPIRFDDPSTLEEWKTVDDVVMGGHSDSTFEWVDEPVEALEPAIGFLRYTGRVTLADGGGFCSGRLEEADRGAPGTDRLRLLARGDGNRYKLTLRTALTPESSSWRLPFDPPAGDWSIVEFPLEAFELWRRGSRLQTDRSVDPARLTSIGVLISDRQAGPFTLDVAEIWAE
ncbi:MAG: CIA30 family protein [Bradymonadaceae bacterium]